MFLGPLFSAFVLRYSSTGDELRSPHSTSLASSLCSHDYHHQVAVANRNLSVSSPPPLGASTSTTASAVSVGSEREQAVTSTSMAYGVSHTGSFPPLLSPPDHPHLVAAQPSYSAAAAAAPHHHHHHHASTDSIPSNVYLAPVTLKTEAPAYFTSDPRAAVSNPNGGAATSYFSEPVIPQPANIGAAAAGLAPVYRSTCWPAAAKTTTFPPVTAPAPVSPASVPWYDKPSPSQSPPLPVLQQGSSVFTFPSPAPGARLTRDGSLPGSLQDLNMTELRSIWHPSTSSAAGQQAHTGQETGAATTLPPLLELHPSTSMEASSSPSMSDQLENAIPIGSNGPTSALPTLQSVDVEHYTPSVIDGHSDSLEESKSRLHCIAVILKWPA